MPPTISLYNIQVRIWPPKAMKQPQSHLDLQFCYDIEAKSLFLKQYPQIYITDSYAYCEFPETSFFFTASKVFPSGATTIHLMIHSAISAKLFVSMGDTVSTAQEEIVTLNMCCTLADTDIPASSRLEIIISNPSQESENVTLLLDALRMSAPTTKQTYSQGCNFVEASDTASTAPISISGHELDKMDSLSTKLSQHTLHDKITDIITQQRRRRKYLDNNCSRSHDDKERLRPLDQFRVQTPDQPNPVEVEQVLKENAESLAEFFRKEFGADDSMPPGSMFLPRKHFSVRRIPSTTAWEDLALQHGKEMGHKPKIRQTHATARVSQTTMMTLQELGDNTGGYCLDPNRDYTKVGDGGDRFEDYRRKKGRNKSRVFVVPSCVQATSIPRTQNLRTEQQPASKDSVKHIEHRHW